MMQHHQTSFLAVPIRPAVEPAGGWVWERPDPGRGIRIEAVGDTPGFERLRDEWTELLASSAADCFFLTWEWLFTWWKHLSESRKLSLLTIRDGGRLLGIAPLALRPARVRSLLPFRALEFLGSGTVGSDYPDLILRRGSEAAALEALALHLERGRHPVEMANIRAEASQAFELGRCLGERRWTLWKAATNVCPVVHLEGLTWEGYLASLGRSHRSNFLRRSNNLSRRFRVRLDMATTEDQRRESLAILVDLHHRCREGRSPSEAFHTAPLLTFHDELSRVALQRGWLRLFVLRLDERPVASLYGFHYRRRFYFYQSGFDPLFARQSVGLVLMGLSIRQALREGASEYDLLHGDELYKFHWAREARTLARLELYPPGIGGRIRRQATRWMRAARKLARRTLFRSRLSATTRAENAPQKGDFQCSEAFSRPAARAR